MCPGTAGTSGALVCWAMIAVLLTLPAATVAAGPGGGQVKQQLRAYFASLHEQGALNGSVLIARERKVLLASGYGLADVEASERCHRRTAFQIGRLTEGFSATALLMLRDQGLLSLDDTVSQFIPGLPSGPEITLRQVLSHSSGLFNYFGNPDLYPNIEIMHTPEELLEYFIHQPLSFEPGTAYEYSASNYVVAGLVVERASGLPLEQFLDSYIAAPLRLRHTAYDPLGMLEPRRCAVGYWNVFTDPPTQAPAAHSSVFYAAGGMIGTVDDLLAFAATLSYNPLLPGPSLQEMLTPGLGDAGMGWYVDSMDISGTPRRHVWQGSDSFGYRSHLSYLIDDGVCVILLLNTSEPRTDLRDMARVAAEMVLSSD